jgi:nitroreductase
MDVIEAIRKRRSIRQFTADPISREDLETIVDAGRLAPTGNNRQPWDFVVVTDRIMLEQFAMAEPWIPQASAAILVVMNPESRWWIEDGSAAIENILLACTALGYASCWVEGDVLPHEDYFKTLLGIPSAKRLLAVLPIGVAAETPSPEKKSLESVLHWERF